MMNKVQRMRAVLSGQTPDRVPASFWFHFPEAQAHGEESVKAHLEYYRQADLDFLKIMNEHPYRVDDPIKTPTDWRKLKPAPLESEFYQAQLDEIKRITDALGGDCLTTTTLFNPFASGNHASGKLVTEHLKADPESVHAGLAVIAESLAVFAVACLDAGADGIYYSAQGGEADRFTEMEFINYIKPHDLTVLNAIDGKGELNILHICRDNIRMNLYSNYPAHVINWAAKAPHNIPLASGKELFKRPILGGLDNNGVIVDGSLEEIEEAVHEVIRSFDPEGLILGADCTLPTEIDLANIQAAVAACASFPMESA